MSSRQSQVGRSPTHSSNVCCKKISRSACSSAIAIFWTYRDPDGSLIGFGTLDVCGECGEFTGGKLHPYLPLLAINPTIKSRGYGTSIVRHLIDEAALLALRGLCHDVLFLDVYTASEKAIRVYTECGFATVSPEPIPDPQEGGKTYIVMAKRISIAS